MNAEDLKHLHPNDVVLWLHVEAAVWRLAEAAHVGLDYVRPTPLKDIQCEQGTSLYGQCRFYRNNRHGLVFTVRRRFNGEFINRRIQMYQLIDTIAHEMAHAKAGWKADHGPAFTRAHGRLLLLAEKLKLRVDIAKSGVKIPE